MRITSRTAASREAQSASVATSGSVPVLVRYVAAARNRKAPAKRSFHGVCPRVFQILVASYFVLVAGCDMGDGNYTEHSDVHHEETVDLRCEGVTVIDERQREAIAITDVVLRESEGGYYTNNRFMCNVRSRGDCELWLEVCDPVDGHRFSEIHDESWTRRPVTASPHGSSSTYNVNIVVDGDGESVKSVVTLWGKLLSGGDAIILFKTNAVLGTWKGR